MAYETLLKSWGDPGVEWKDGWAFAKDEPLPAEWANFLFDNLIKDVTHTIDHLNTLDPEADGTVVNADKVDGLHAEQLGGFKFATVDTPENLTEAVSWYKTSTGVLYISDGEKFDAHPEIGYQETETFSEEGFSVTHDTVPRTELVGGNIKLIDEVSVAQFGSGVAPDVAEWSWDSITNLTTSGSRLAFDANGSDITRSLVREAPIRQDVGLDIELGRDTGNINDSTGFRLTDNSGNRVAVVEYADGAGNVTVNGEEVFASWDAGVTYQYRLNIDWDAGIVEAVVDGISLGSFPFMDAATEVTNIEFFNNLGSSNDPRTTYYDNVFEGARMYGEAIISWPEPDNRIVDWDMLLYDHTTNGETVIVDVLDESGNVLVADIDDHGDLSAAVPSDVNLDVRVRLGRDSENNQPTFDSVYRRWTMRAGDTGKSPQEWDEHNAYIETRFSNAYTDLVERSGDTMTGPLTLGEDLTATDGETIWDETASHVPQERVEQGHGSGLDSDTLDGKQLEKIEKEAQQKRFMHGLLQSRNN
ncbi:hypothetical protein [Halorubrum sp. F4]|uniref:hypothetical protein n=1 Tax=Halorubrum sp. F4 TaxID=2989715 RepID=UPI002480C389|nr:hypothetical protein [Halorubrum sp. F4]